MKSVINNQLLKILNNRPIRGLLLVVLIVFALFVLKGTQSPAHAALTPSPTSSNGSTSGCTNSTTVTFNWTRQQAGYWYRITWPGAGGYVYAYDVSSYTASGFTPGWSGTWSLRSQNSNVDAFATDWSSEVVSNFNAPVCPPSGLTATPVSQTQINLSWNGGNTILAVCCTAYIYRGGSLIAAPSAGPGSNTYSSTGLTCGTNYSYYIQNYNGPSTSPTLTTATNTASATTSACTPPPGAFSLTATPASCSQINLSWTVSSNATSYSIYRGGSFVNSTTGTSYNDTGRAASTPYSYQLLANGPGGSTWSNVSSTSTPSCNVAPNTPTLTAPPNGSGTTGNWINYVPTFTATVSDPNSDNTRAYFHFLQVTSNPAVPGDQNGTTVTSGSSSTWAAGALSDGKYDWQAAAIDPSSLWSAYTAYWRVKKDTLAPTANCNAPTNTGQTINITSLTGSDSLPASGGTQSGIQNGTLERSLNGGSYSTVSSPAGTAAASGQEFVPSLSTSFSETGATGSTYTYRWTVRDGANNVSTTTACGSVVIPKPDLTVQSITLNPVTPVATNTVTATVVVRNVSASVSAGAARVRFWSHLGTAPDFTASAEGGIADQNTGVIVANGTQSLNFTFTKSTSGSYTAYALVDNGDPGAVDEVDNSALNNRNSLAYTVNPLPDYTISWSNPGTQTINPGDPGNYSFNVAANCTPSWAGNIGISLSYTNTPAQNPNPDGTVTAGALSTASINPLNCGANTSALVNFTISTTAGTVRGNVYNILVTGTSAGLPNKTQAGNLNIREGQWLQTTGGDVFSNGAINFTAAPPSNNYYTSQWVLMSNKTPITNATTSAPYYWKVDNYDQGGASGFGGLISYDRLKTLAGITASTAAPAGGCTFNDASKPTAQGTFLCSTGITVGMAKTNYFATLSKQIEDGLARLKLPTLSLNKLTFYKPKIVYNPVTSVEPALVRTNIFTSFGRLMAKRIGQMIAFFLPKQVTNFAKNIVPTVQAAANETPVRTGIAGSLYTNAGWDSYTMGYRFKPNVDGQITAFAAHASCSGTSRTVYLYSDAGTLLTSAAITTNGGWNTTTLGTPYSVTANIYYRIGVYPSSCASYYNPSSPTFPTTVGSITIDTGVYSSGNTSPVTFAEASLLRGIPDITFSSGGGGSCTYFPGSVIATSGDETKMSGWLPGKSGTLLYRRSTNGASAATFHSLSDNQGETLVVYKNTNGYVYGGYDPLSWDSSSGYKAGSGAFLFNLTNNFKLNQTNTTYQTYNSSGYGPVFGGGFDIWTNMTSGGNNPHSYENPSLYGYTYVGGVSSWTISDVEVYKLAACSGGGGGTPVTFNPTSTGQSGTIQTYNVPTTGSYTIEAWGAQGGSGSSYTGGLGAYIKGTLSLTAGNQLKILVGQQGGTAATYQAGGGGGGSFVTSSTNSPYIVAGGGSGGGGNSYVGNGNPGLTGNSGGGSGNYSGGSGGSGGGAGLAGSSGGGGLTGNGTNAGYGSGISFTNGGTGGGGGSCPAGGGSGGFGGGSGGEWCAQGVSGAGGGYSGGAGADNASNLRAGAGGSYNGGTSQTNTAGIQSGAGKVVITPPAAPPANLYANTLSTKSGSCLGTPTATFPVGQSVAVCGNIGNNGTGSANNFYYRSYRALTSPPTSGTTSDAQVGPYTLGAGDYQTTAFVIATASTTGCTAAGGGNYTCTAYVFMDATGIITETNETDNIASVNYTVSTCTATSPGAPTLQSPADAATDISISAPVTWSAPGSWGTECNTGGTRSYNVYIQAGATPPATVTTNLTEGSLTYPPTLTYSTPYAWQIESVSKDNLKTKSAARTFTTAAAVVTETVLFVDGDMTINSDLLYDNTNQAAMFVVNGKVNITNNVTQINAFIYAENGIGYTSDNTAVKINQLVINGGLIIGSGANGLPVTVNFNRLTNNYTTTPAEIINYNPRILTSFTKVAGNRLGTSGTNFNEVTP